MTLNPEFQFLCQRWREKASQYSTDNVHELFDKFFSLYVTYNALYVEATTYLHRKAINEGKEAYKLVDGRFPDKDAATKYVLDLLKSKSLLDSIENTPITKDALDQIKAIINENSSIDFWICLDPIWGTPQKEKDKELRQMLNSSSADERARALLQLIYEIRCNMFHGRKGVRPVQKKLLIPIVTILEKIVDKLYRKLKDAPYIDRIENH